MQRQKTGASQKEILLAALTQVATCKQISLIPDYYKNPALIDGSHLPFKFVDLFAGIGGFRIGLEKVGGKCAFTCEWDKYSQKTYRAWFGEEKIAGDIREIHSEDIPDHDVMAAGFPCQPFSIAGVSKKASLGRQHGFEDKTQGTLFFHLAMIAQIKRPPVLFLENVKNLLSHDKGQTWNVILSTLEEELGYKVFFKVIDAADYVPQHRERVIIVAFDKSVFGDTIPFKFPTPPTDKRPQFKSILERTPPDDKYILSDKLWRYLQKYAENHRAKGNGFGFGMTDVDSISRTMSARYYKDGSEILIPRGNGKNPRRMTPSEAARLMGFHNFANRIVVSDTQAYKQFGNAVVPAVVEAVGREIVNVLRWHVLTTGTGCLLKGRS